MGRTAPAGQCPPTLVRFAEAACAALAEKWPKITFASRDGYFDAEPSSVDNRRLLATIDAFEPDVIFVGMGMPRQELWISRNRSAIRRGVIFSVGAAFDYEAGVQAAAPRWMGRIGLEWLFRLASQPRRLAHRYLIEPWRLLRPALRDLATARSNSSDPSFRKPAVDRGSVWPVSSAN